MSFFLGYVYKFKSIEIKLAGNINRNLKHHLVIKEKIYKKMLLFFVISFVSGVGFLFSFSDIIFENLTP